MVSTTSKQLLLLRTILALRFGCDLLHCTKRYCHHRPQTRSLGFCQYPKKNVIIGKIAGGSSGKGGDFIAEWAIPKRFALLSFKLHGELAQRHIGDRIWGHRSVFAAEIKLLAHNLTSPSPTDIGALSVSEVDRSADLDWLLSGSVESYHEIGDLENSDQVNPFMFTTTLAQLAEEKGVNIRTHTSVVKINTKDDGVVSVTIDRGGDCDNIDATDVVGAAGPWTSQLLPQLPLLAPRGHSVIVKPTRPLSPYILFPDIQPAPGHEFRKLLSLDIYPRPADGLHAFDTVYSSGPDDYSVPLPKGIDSVELDEKQCDDVTFSIGSVFKELHEGHVITKQACYKPQIRKHEEDEETGPIVGPMKTKGLWVATGHDERGIQNAPATGLIMSEMIFEGKAHSADVKDLDPVHFTV
ncbi:DAO-domain-containing protein [Tothia fuscella]|uniref:DAO-domain-containing protein n=1 Tax=Tothia fuscella TaxID=1048955 RepID=A0A9P4NH80_9PEZI|nr:DAO-domain-containing protein [Tothia fuscella]